MSVVEKIITDNFFDRSIFNLFNELKLDDNKENEVNNEKIDFWYEISQLFNEIEEIDQNGYNRLLEYKNKLQNKKEWQLENTFLNEQLFSYDQYLTERRRLKIFTGKTKQEELFTVIDFYDKKHFFIRKHQALYRSAVFYLRNGKNNQAYLAYVTLIASIRKNKGQYLDKWFLPLFSELKYYISFDLLESLISIKTRLFEDENIKNIVANLLLTMSWDKEWIYLLPYISYMKLDPEIFSKELTKYTGNIAENSIQRYFRFLFKPEIYNKYNLIDYIIKNYKFFSDFKIQNRTNIFQIIKGLGNETQDKVLENIFKNGKEIEIESLVDLILSFIDDLNKLSDYKTYFEEIITNLNNIQASMNSFEKLIPIVSHLELSDQIEMMFFENFEIYLQKDQYTLGRFALFVENLSVEQYLSCVKQFDLKTIIKDKIKYVVESENSLSTYLKLKLLIFADFEIPALTENLKDIFSAFIKDYLNVTVSKDERRRTSLFLQQLIENFDLFVIEKSHFNVISEINDIFKVLTQSFSENDIFNVSQYFEGFSDIFKDEKCLNYIWEISNFGLSQLLQQKTGLNSRPIEKYFLILNEIEEKYSYENNRLSNEIKQLFLELEKSFSLLTKNLFQNVLETIGNNFISREAVAYSFISKMLAEGIFPHKVIGILREISELLQSSSNLPNLMYANGTKVFTKIYYLATFDTICNLFLLRNEVSLEEKNEIIRTKLLLLRALGHLSGRNHEITLEKACFLLKEFEQSCEVDKSSIKQLIDSTPWKYTNLEQEYLRNNKEEIEPLYGVSFSNLDNTLISNSTKVNRFDIGISRYAFKEKELELMEKLSDKLELNTGGILA